MRSGTSDEVVVKEDMEVEVEGEEEEEGSGKLGIIPFTVDLTHWGYRSALLPCCVQCSCTCAHLIAQCSLSCHKLWGSTPHLGSGVRGQRSVIPCGVACPTQGQGSGAPCGIAHPTQGQGSWAPCGIAHPTQGQGSGAPCGVAGPTQGQGLHVG